MLSQIEPRYASTKKGRVQNLPGSLCAQLAGGNPKGHTNAADHPHTHSEEEHPKTPLGGPVKVLGRTNLSGAKRSADLEDFAENDRVGSASGGVNDGAAERRDHEPDMGWAGEGKEVFKGRSHGLGCWLVLNRKLNCDGLVRCGRAFALFVFMTDHLSG